MLDTEVLLQQILYGGSTNGNLTVTNPDVAGAPGIVVQMIGRVYTNNMAGLNFGRAFTIKN